MPLVRRGSPVSFSAASVEKPADVVEAHTTIVEALADGTLTSSEAAEISQVIEAFTRALVASQILAAEPDGRQLTDSKSDKFMDAMKIAVAEREAVDPSFDGSHMERVDAMKGILTKAYGPVR